MSNYRNNTRSRSFSAQRTQRPYSGGGRSNFGRKGPKKQYINTSLYVKTAKAVGEEVYSPNNAFHDFVVHPQLKKNIEFKGFKQPSPIQDQAIPHGLEGRDVIGIASTGTGKTVAFGVPVINKLIEDPSAKAIILAPTRELAEQILEELKSLSFGTKVFWALLIGGAPIYKQFRDLDRNPRLVIGTPGRIKDHIERKSLKLNDFNIAVLDEVDRMLDMGFIDDIRSILEELPAKRQSFFFSATIDQKVRKIVDAFSYEPISITMSNGQTSENVHQNVVKFQSSDQKIELLHDVLIKEKGSKVLIFDDTRRDVEKLDKELQSRGFLSDSIHGGRSQGQRRKALAKFKDNRSNVLVATDVAARGIDVDGITHVINYSTPASYADYTHRIGRAGRAGKIGHALTFILENSY